MGLPDIDYPTQQFAYCGCLTMSRELFLKKGQLKQCPFPEFQTLRKQVLVVQSISLDSDLLEYKLVFEIGVKLRIKNKDAKKWSSI